MVKMQEQDTGWRVAQRSCARVKDTGHDHLIVQGRCGATLGRSGAVLGRGARGVNY